MSHLGRCYRSCKSLYTLISHNLAQKNAKLLPDGPVETKLVSDQAAATQNMLRGDKRFYQPEPTLRRIRLGSHIVNGFYYTLRG